MSWALDKKTTGNINEGGTKLPLGESVHTIEKAEEVKQQNSNEKQVLLETKSNGSSFRIYLSVEAENDTVRNIAQSTLFTFWTEAGFDEALTPARLKKLTGKTFKIDVSERDGKVGTRHEGKKFTNITGIKAVFDSVVEEESPDSDESEGDAPKKAPWEK